MGWLCSGPTRQGQLTFTPVDISSQQSIILPIIEEHNYMAKMGLQQKLLHNFMELLAVIDISKKWV